MADKGDLDLTDLGQRRWVRFDLPVLVCVDTDASGDQHVRHIVPILDDIELAVDDQHEPVVYRPNSTERVPDRRADDAAWQAISHGGRPRTTGSVRSRTTTGTGWKTPKTSPLKTLTPKKKPVRPTMATWSGFRRGELLVKQFELFEQTNVQPARCSVRRSPTEHPPDVKADTGRSVP